MNTRRAFLSPDNLSLAWRRMRRSKAAPGVDGVTWETFDRFAEEFLRDLRKDLAKGGYEAAPLRGALLPKHSGGWRPLGIPTYRDRVAQRALLNVLNPIVEPELESCSFAYREGLSIFHALAKVEQYRDRGLTHVVEADIDDCFESIDHDLLLACLAQYVNEPWVLELVKGWIAAPVVFTRGPGARVGRRYERVRGVPQGAIISPLLCNLFLDEFDEALLKRKLALVRYADDLVVLASREQRAYEALDLTVSALGSLDLRLEERKTRVTSFEEGFEYLGVVFVGSLALPTFRIETTDGKGNPSVRFLPGYPGEAGPRGERVSLRLQASERKRLMRKLAGRGKLRSGPTALEIAFRQALEQLDDEGKHEEVALWTPSAVIA